MPFPIFVHLQEQNGTGIYVNLAAWRRAYEDYVVAPHDDRPNLLRVVWISDVVSIFKDQVHVLIVAVESSSHGTAALQLDQYDLA